MANRKTEKKYFESTRLNCHKQNHSQPKEFANYNIKNTS